MRRDRLTLHQMDFISSLARYASPSLSSFPSSGSTSQLTQLQLKIQNDHANQPPLQEARLVERDGNKARQCHHIIADTCLSAFSCCFPERRLGVHPGCRSSHTLAMTGRENMYTLNDNSRSRTQRQQEWNQHSIPLHDLVFSDLNLSVQVL